MFRYRFYVDNQPYEASGYTTAAAAMRAMNDCIVSEGLGREPMVWEPGE